jgi:hypothetical protein
VKIALKQTPLMSASQLVELASSADLNFQQAGKAIDRLQKDVAEQKRRISERWKGLSISQSDRDRLSAQELRNSVVEIVRNAEPELDRLMKRAHELATQAEAQRDMWDSPVKVLARQGLGLQQRSEYHVQLRDAGPAEVAHIGQLAVGTSNAVLAAAVLSRLDALPSKDRPFSAQELAAAVGVEEYAKANEAIRIASNRGQATINAIRAFRQGRQNPFNNLADAMRRSQEDLSLLEDGGDD